MKGEEPEAGGGRKDQVARDGAGSFQDQAAAAQENEEFDRLLAGVDPCEEARKLVRIGGRLLERRHRKVVLETKQNGHQQHARRYRRGDRERPDHPCRGLQRLEDPWLGRIGVRRNDGWVQTQDPPVLHGGQREETRSQKQQILAGKHLAKRSRCYPGGATAEAERGGKERRVALQLAGWKKLGSGQPEQRVEDDLEEIGCDAGRERDAR